jgi:DASH complex subunit DAD1
MEQIITNMNLLNRSVEGIIAVHTFPCAHFLIVSQVGKEFESVSTLWRSFHEVLAKGEVPPEDDVMEADDE